MKIGNNPGSSAQSVAVKKVLVNFLKTIAVRNEFTFVLGVLTITTVRFPSPCESVVSERRGESPVAFFH